MVFDLLYFIILLVIFLLKCQVKSFIYFTIYSLNKLNIIHAVSNWTMSFMIVNLPF